VSKNVSVAPLPSEMSTVIREVPTRVGVPSSSPRAPRRRPAGSFPRATANVYGLVPPDARSRTRTVVSSVIGFTFAGWIATLAGWLVTEIGRQPWLVTGILRTADAAGEASGAELGASLTAYVLTYGALLLAYMVTLTHMARK